MQLSEVLSVGCRRFRKDEQGLDPLSCVLCELDFVGVRLPGCFCELKGISYGLKTILCCTANYCTQLTNKCFLEF